MSFDPKNWQPPADDPAVLTEQLLDALRDLWTRGWMPADVVAVATFNHTTRVVDLCGTLILAEHEREGYGDKVTPRWHRQLSSLTERRAPRVRADDLYDLYLTLSMLPALRSLGLPPGDANAGTVRTEPGLGPPHGGDAADPDTLRRVRALLAKAESTEFDAEAEAFTAKAQTLIAAHSLQHLIDSLDTEGEPGGGPEAIRLAVERPYDGQKFALLGVVARANRCRAILHRGLGLATVVGFAVDLDAVELLYTSLLVQATAAMQRHGSTTDPWGNSTTAVFRRSFLTGFAGKINARLTAATEDATSAAEQAAGGSRLAPVLASRADEVTRAVEEAFPHTSPMRSRAQLDGSGYAAGVAAANRADLGVRRPLAS